MTEKKPPQSLPKVSPKPEPLSKIQPEEVGGQKGPEPTRYGDWENKGRVSDF